jgi:acetyl-CoA carboxylase carboxyl transferase subunit alpha
MSSTLMDFERAIEELEVQIERVKRLTQEQGIDRQSEIGQLEQQKRRLLQERYMNLSAWDKTQVARHPKRPYSLNLIPLMFRDWTELHGDRLFGDDGAIIGGIARLDDQPVLVIGQEKGRDAHERHRRNFGYAKPEGYRKALRLMRMAEKFRRPVVCLIDTPGADPSVQSEERGISEAIARNLHEMFRLRVPIVVAIIGEGGSGGALGIGIGDRVLMLEHAIYSVIAPEGCANILWRDAKRAPEAAEALRVTAQDARGLGAVDEIVPEGLGGAHRNRDVCAAELRAAILRHLEELGGLSVDELLQRRYDRFRRLGSYRELAAEEV